MVHCWGPFWSLFSTRTSHFSFLTLFTYNFVNNYLHVMYISWVSVESWAAASQHVFFDLWKFVIYFGVCSMLAVFSRTMTFHISLVWDFPQNMWSFPWRPWRTPGWEILFKKAGALLLWDFQLTNWPLLTGTIKTHLFFWIWTFALQREFFPIAGLFVYMCAMTEELL